MITIETIDVFSDCTSNIFDNIDTKKALSTLNFSKLPAKSKSKNGSNKKNDKIEKATASKLHNKITQILDL